MSIINEIIISVETSSTKFNHSNTTSNINTSNATMPNSYSTFITLSEIDSNRTNVCNRFQLCGFMKT